MYFKILSLHNRWAFQWKSTCSLDAKGSRICYPKICLFGNIDYFRLILIKSRLGRKLWKPTRSSSLSKDIYMCKGISLTAQACPFTIKGDLSTYQSYPGLGYFPGNLLYSPPPTSFVFSGGWYLQWWLRKCHYPIVLGLSLVYKRYVFKLCFFFS